MNDKEADDVVQSIWRVFPPVFRLIRQNWQRGKHSEFSVYHYEIMGILFERGDMSMTEIGRFLGITKSNITPLIDKLVSNDMVERFNDKTDRRIIKVALTKKGEKFLMDGKENTKQEYKNLFADFSREEIDELTRSLGEIHRLLSRI